VEDEFFHDSLATTGSTFLARWRSKPPNRLGNDHAGSDVGLWVRAGSVAVMAEVPAAAPALARGVRVLAVPGLPPGVEVRASPRRRRTVTAYREGGRTIVLVPARMSRSDIVAFVHDLVGRLEAREQRSRPSDAELSARAEQLSRTHLGGRAAPRSVRWVANQHRRWGSCTPADATIRLSSRLQAMPSYVLDYVLLHELVHLLVPGHGSDFEAWMLGFPRLLEARAFLAGVDHARATDRGPEPDLGIDDVVDGPGSRVDEAPAADEDPIVDLSTDRAAPAGLLW
jgi:hypothetical protein